MSREAAVTTAGRPTSADAELAALAADVGADGVAVLSAASVDELHLLLLARGPRRRTTLDAELVFRALHPGGVGALTTARLLLTDSRWDRLTPRLVRGLLRAGLLTEDELDGLAVELLMADRLAVPVDGRLFEGGPVVDLETGRIVPPRLNRQARRRRVDPVVAYRRIGPPLRRWAAERVTRRRLLALSEVGVRLGVLPVKDGAAATLGILDAYDALAPPEATDLLEQALVHGSGRVRTAALLLLTRAGQGERAVALAAGDRDAGVRQALAPRPPEPVAATLF